MTTMKNKIREGDVVRITFVNSRHELTGMVLYTPAATGDSWRIKTDDGEIVYINSFECMYKITEAEVCPRCNGHGEYAVEGTARSWMQRCGYCSGKGWVTK